MQLFYSYQNAKKKSSRTYPTAVLRNNHFLLYLICLFSVRLNICISLNFHICRFFENFHLGIIWLADICISSGRKKDYLRVSAVGTYLISSSTLEPHVVTNTQWFIHITIKKLYDKYRGWHKFMLRLWLFSIQFYG